MRIISGTMNLLLDKVSEILNFIRFNSDKVFNFSTIELMKVGHKHSIYLYLCMLV